MEGSCLWILYEHMMIAIVVAMFGEGSRWMSDVHWHLTRVCVCVC